MEEFHRGKWIPLRLKNDDQKTVRITENTAEIMNMDSEATKERYVLVEGSEDTAPKNDAPAPASGVDPLKDKKVTDFKLAELQGFCDLKEIDYIDTDTKAILWEKLSK